MVFTDGRTEIDSERDKRLWKKTERVFDTNKEIGTDWQRKEDVKRRKRDNWMDRKSKQRKDQKKEKDRDKERLKCRKALKERLKRTKWFVKKFF